MIVSNEEEDKNDQAFLGESRLLILPGHLLTKLTIPNRDLFSVPSFDTESLDIEQLDIEQSYTETKLHAELHTCYAHIQD